MDEAYRSLATVKFCLVKNHSSNFFKREVTYVPLRAEPPNILSKVDKLEEKCVKSKDWMFQNITLSND